MITQTVRQSTAIAIGGQGVLIEGPPGCGKTSLALALIDRGATLIGDDGVSLSLERSRLIASPPPNTAGCLEIRNIGIVRLETTIAPVCLAISISKDAPRYIETAGQIALLGQQIPHIMIDLGRVADAIRLEYALALHGLPVV